MKSETTSTHSHFNRQHIIQASLEEQLKDIDADIAIMNKRRAAVEA